MVSSKVLATLVVVLVAISLIGAFLLAVLPGIPVAPAVATASGTVNLYVPPQPYSTGAMVSVVVLP